MMFGVNAFSATLTFVTLVQSGELLYSLDFVTRHPEALIHIFGFSITGATGQLFIFYTIKTFGPLVFTLIMTTRQLVSIILSTLIYGHSIDSTGVSGMYLCIYVCSCVHVYMYVYRGH
jgi:adenosine 3'-phospho 5'-phosphosulfate transporter B2